MNILSKEVLNEKTEYLTEQQHEKLVRELMHDLNKQLRLVKKGAMFIQVTHRSPTTILSAYSFMLQGGYKVMLVEIEDVVYLRLYLRDLPL